MGKTLDLDELRTLLITANLQSVTKASDVLNVTQPAITHRLRRLEERVGTKLIDRSQKHFSLTPQGQALENFARQMIELESEALSHLKEIHQEREICISMTELFPSRKMASFLKNIEEELDGTKPKFVIQLSGKTRSQLNSGNVDIGICQKISGVDCENSSDEKKFSCETLKTEQLKWVGSCDVSLQKDNEYPFISYGEESIYDKWLRSLPTEMGVFRVAHYVSSVAAAVETADRGLAITLVSEAHVGQAASAAIGLPEPPKIEHFLISKSADEFQLSAAKRAIKRAFKRVEESRVPAKVAAD